MEDYDQNTRLIDLTEKDLIEIINSCLSEKVRDIKELNEKSHVSDIIYLDEVIKLVGCSKGTIYNKVNRSEMPVLSRGQPLTFSRKDLQNWIRNGRPTLAEMKATKIVRR